MWIIMAEEQSRTFLLDQQLVRGLVTQNFSPSNDALTELPEALSRREISDLGLQVSQTTGPDNWEAGYRLEKQVIASLGAYALYMRSDLVTAQNVADELREHRDFIGWAMLSLRIRKSRQHIVQSMLDFSAE
jgi:hypothetical protein